jgi:hypothetical protein
MRPLPEELLLAQKGVYQASWKQVKNWDNDFDAAWHVRLFLVTSTLPIGC